MEVWWVTDELMDRLMDESNFKIHFILEMDNNYQRLNIKLQWIQLDIVIKSFAIPCILKTAKIVTSLLSIIVSMLSIIALYPI